jgi:hypothetical protein
VISTFGFKSAGAEWPLFASARLFEGGYGRITTLTGCNSAIVAGEILGTRVTNVDITVVTGWSFGLKPPTTMWGLKLIAFDRGRTDSACQYSGLRNWNPLM